MNEEGLTNLKVVKRNGKKVDFDGTKIAVEYLLKQTKKILL